MAKRSWKLQDAKNRLSEVIELAIKEGPQQVTKRGEPAVVIIAHAEFLKLGRRKKNRSFVALIRTSPMIGAELDLTRQRDSGRETDGLFD